MASSVPLSFLFLALLRFLGMLRVRGRRTLSDNFFFMKVSLSKTYLAMRMFKTGGSWLSDTERTASHFLAQLVQ